jgi:4-amino-4-deoxy-L-arabinose transferase-like glycosyltransferase
VLVFQALQPMSDVVATFWAIAAIFCARRARNRRGWAIPAGAAFGIAFLVRPTNAALLPALAFALPARWATLGLFAAAGSPFAGLFAAYNLRCYGAPLSTGYGKTELLKEFALAQFPPRIRYYVLDLVRTFGPLVPAAWLGLAADRKTAARDRGLLVAWFGSYLLLFSLYWHYGSIVFDRFLLPGVPALAVGGVILVNRLVAGRRGFQLAGAALVGAGILFEIRGVRRLDVLEIVRDQSVYPETCRWASEVLPPRALIVSMQASGALEYYTDLAYIRWNWIEPASFAALRREVERRGFSWFALVFPVDADEVRRRMPGHWTIIGDKRGVGLWRLDP